MAEASEHRFAHLLKPIRDLAENWNIDIASELEDYLTSLTEIEIDFDGKTKLNFAEAALLIQGSAYIYSKKVEFLYSLIYQCLDIVSRRVNRVKKKSSVDAEGADADAVVQAEAEFLMLDDHLDEAKNIDLQESKEDTYQNKRNMTLVVRAPLSALNTKSARSAKRQDANDYKISEYSVHANGALLLEEGDSKLVDMSFRRDSGIGCMPFGSPASLLKSKSLAPLNDILNKDARQDEIAKELDFPNAEQQADIEGGQDLGNFSDNDDGVGFDVSSSPLADDKRQPSASEVQEDLEPEDDPWGTLDPHEECKDIKPKPMRLGKTFRVPRFTPRQHKLSVRANRLLVFEPIGDLTEITHSMTQPSIPDFTDVYVDVLKRRHSIRRARQAKLREARQQSRDKRLGKPDGRQHPEDEFYDDHGDFGASSDEDFDITKSRGPDEAEHFDESLQDFDIPAEALPSNKNGGDDFLDQSGLEGVDSFEELCRRHVKAYLEAAEQYMTRTELSERVASWEARIVPFLKEMDSRPEFDIHVYGEKIIETIDRDTKGTEDAHDKVAGFSKVVEGKKKFEVCRMFLATLQLANNRAVDITPKIENGVQSLGVILLAGDEPYNPSQRIEADLKRAPNQYPFKENPERKFKRVKVMVSDENARVKRKPSKAKTRKIRRGRKGLDQIPVNII
ncbi:hypothetical protein AAMO2058_000675500 [Amorphochlora amoebiformis]|eukprot:1356344-Amorphochlora_amoeboformis.AAC.2